MMNAKTMTLTMTKTEVLWPTNCGRVGISKARYGASQRIGKLAYR